MIAELYLYFGIIGLASIAAWIGALVMIARYVRHERRTLFFVRALCLALVGCLLAGMNSHRVSLIRVDRAQELKEAYERQMRLRKAEMEALKNRAADIRFAEDSEYDYLDLAGVESADKKTIYERAAEGERPVYLYKQAGEQQRAQRREGELTEIDLSLEKDEETELEQQHGIIMPERDRAHATKLARINLRTSRFVFLVVLLFLVFDYFSRFNRTFGAVLPLPLSGRFVDHLFPKTHSAVLLSEQPGLPALPLGREQAGLAKQYLESIVRKGESFIYFGSADRLKGINLARFHIPVVHLCHDFIEAVWPAGLFTKVSRLLHLTIKGRPLREWCCPRLWMGIRSVLLKTGFLIRKAFGFVAVPVRCLTHGSAAAKPIRGLRQRAGNINLWPVRVITVSQGQEAFSLDFIFESAWFSRYSFIIEGQSAASDIMESLLDFLRERFKPHAVARKTVNIVWDMETPLSREMLQSLAALSREANFKLIMFSADPRASGIETLVEEMW